MNLEAAAAAVQVLGGPVVLRDTQLGVTVARPAALVEGEPVPVELVKIGSLWLPALRVLPSEADGLVDGALKVEILAFVYARQLEALGWSSPARTRALEQTISELVLLVGALKGEADAPPAGDEASVQFDQS